MTKVAKVVLVVRDNQFLLLHRSNHPTFGTDPDLPGGTWEEGETLEETALREVYEEIGAQLDQNSLHKLFSGTSYSAHGTVYELFITYLKKTPDIMLSWEHSAYEWLNKSDFIKKSREAKDTYMYMVADVMERST